MRPGRILLCLAAMSVAVSAASASTVIGLSVEDQARLSRMVVVGQVTGVAGEDDPVHGIESAVSLLVTDVFKGDVRAGETIVFHTHGGEVDGVISEAVGEAVFRPGRKTLVFIEEVQGRLYNLGLSSGVWNVLEGRGGRVTFVRALTDGLEVFGDTPLETGPVSAGEMANRVGYAVRHPEFDHALLREARR